MNYFITGTDTAVGKTYISALLIRGLRAAGVAAVGMKPICCGGREDAEILHAASGDGISLNDVNPIWLRTPAAPYTAAMIEERMIDLDAIRENFARLRRQYEALIVEGAGGWLVPIRRDFSMADLAGEMNLPVVIVVANKLGAINHTLLTVRDIHARGMSCAGVILNDAGSDDVIATTTNRGVLETLLEVPILAEVSRGQTELTLGVC